MRYSLPLKLTSIVLLCAFWGLLGEGVAQAQDASVGGPYEADSATVLLMHFDGDITDASDSALDGDFATEVSGSQTPGGTQPYFDDYGGPRSGFGQSIHFDNDASLGSGEYVKVEDTGDSPLDLSGSWTVEGWARATPYNADNAPQIIHKHIFALDNPCANYFIQPRIGSNLDQDAQAGFNGAGGGCNDQVLDTGNDTLQTDEWYHYAYIRDASASRHYLVVRDADLNIVAQASTPFGKNAIGQAGNGPDGDSLYIGVSPNLVNERLEGNVDEVRLSNVVRSELLPAGIIAGVRPGDTDTLYTTPDSDFTVEADIGGAASEVSSVTLHWRTGAQGSFNTVSMSDGDGDGTYTGSIPGQSQGTPVQYYVASETTDGTRSVSPAGAGEEGFLDYYGIGFSDGPPADALVLDLSFEGNEGEVISSVEDNSGYDHGLEVFGDPTYESSIRGNTALQLDGEDDYVAVGATAPFLASEEFTVDFWFNASSVEEGDRFVLKQGGEGITDEQFFINYKVFTFGGDAGIRGASFQKGGGLNGGNLDPGFTPETDTWYRAIYHMSQDTAFFQVRDNALNVVAEAGYTSDDLPATATRGPFFIGFGSEPGSDPVEGLIDNVRVYNYPVSPESLFDPPRIERVTQFAVAQPTGGAPFTVEAEVERTDRDVADVTLHYAAEGGEEFNEVTMTAQNDTLYTADIPEQEEGTTVRYYVSAEDEAGERAVSPEGAETEGEYYELHVGESEVGGPYVADNSTILLMSFDEEGNRLANASDATADGTGFGNLSYGEEGGLSGLELGEQLLLDNDERADSSYVSVPATEALDLSGSYTVEAWVKTDVFAEDHRENPVALSKPFNTTNFTDFPNYDILLGKDGSITNRAWGMSDIRSQPGVVQEGEWYHIAFVKDAEKGVLIQLVHDTNRELVSFEVVGEDGDPNSNGSDLFLGVSGPDNDEGPEDNAINWLDGALDEVRISSVARDFEMPPAVYDVTEFLGQQEVQEPKTIEAEVQALGSSNLASVTLHYGVGNGFQSVAMSPQEGATYAAEIPGQSPNSAVSYYLTAEADNGESTRRPQHGVYTYSVAYEGPVVSLDFEEGMGAPQDASPFAHGVQVGGEPQYSEDAIRGDHAMFFDGEDDYLEIQPSLATASGEFTVSFWFKVEELADANARMLIKEGGAGTTGSWFQPNYQVFANNEEGFVRGANFLETYTGGRLQAPDSITTDTWYRAVYQHTADSAFFQLRGPDNEIYSEIGTTTDRDGNELTEAPLTQGPFRIATANAPNNAFFRGWIDNVDVYNYAADLGSIFEPPRIASVTQFDAVQNVGNAPFTVEAEVERTDRDVADVTLHYAAADADEFEEVAMSMESDSLYVGDIPEQEVGTTVRYYVSAEDETGERAVSPEGAETEGEYYELHVGQENALVLHLAFEEGQGAPVDSSEFGHEVQMLGLQGEPQYSEDAIHGQQSIQFAEEDSSYLEIPAPAPFLAAEEFTLAFWFKVEALNTARMVIKEGDHGVTNNWFEPNYQVFPISADADGEIEIRAASAMQARTGFQNNGSDVETPRGASLDTWYRAIYQVSEDTVFFQVRDSEGEIFDENGYDEEPTEDGPGVAEPTQGPFRVATASNNRFFYGKIDDLRFYNHAIDLDELPVDREEGPALPTEYELSENYPNPFTRSTTIEYALPQATEVTLSVYDLLGRKVATLVDGQKSSGRHQTVFDSDRLGSGVYFYRMETEATTIVRKMTLVR